MSEHRRRDRTEPRATTNDARLATAAPAPSGSGPSPLVHSQVLVTALGDEPLAPLALARQLDVRHVVCVGPRYAEWRVEPLLAVLRRDGRRVDWLQLDAVDVPAALAELEARLPRTGDASVVFDLTNARGVVGFALYELARTLEARAPDRYRLVRVDWSDRVVRAISPDRAEAEPVSVRLGLADFLDVHGKRMLGVERAQGSPSPYGDAARRLAASGSLAQPLLEAVHRGAWDRPLQMRGQRALGRLLGDLEGDGVLEWRSTNLFATSMKAFQFLHGRWLEEYLFELADASGMFDDCASGVRFAWTIDGTRDADVANEIDFAGTTAGRATIASCKTGFRDLNGALYEVLTLAERAAGRSVITVFATTEQLDHYDRRRAAALGIRILDAERLADPARVLGTLVDGGTAPVGGPVAGMDVPAPRGHSAGPRRAAGRRNPPAGGRP